MKCYILSADLMFTSQVSGAAKRAQIETQSIQSAAQLTSPLGAIVVFDLASPRIAIDSTIRELVEMGVQVVAIGPHVQREKLEVAEAAGATRVISKGQAHRELAEILLSLVH